MESPIYDLVAPWWGTPSPRASQISRHRAALYEAAAKEIRLNDDANVIYDPSDDHRFVWACQWLDVANGTRHRIELAVTDCAAMFFTEPAHSRRHSAASNNSLSLSTKH